MPVVEVGKSLFGKTSYFREQAGIYSALNDMRRGLWLVIPEEFALAELPAMKELGIRETVKEFAKYGRFRPERKRELAQMFLCRAKSKLEEIGV